MKTGLVQSGQWDLRGALRDLLNLTEPESAFYGQDSSADEFIARYGELRGLPAIVETLDRHLGIKDRALVGPRSAVRMASALFLAMWKVHDKGPGAQQVFNGCLATIFGPALIGGQDLPAGLRVDILAGTIEPLPRDLLDALALEFMRSYRMIGSCERCRRFFFKSYLRDRYCSRPCGDVARTEAQRNWMRQKRAEQKREKEFRKTKGKGRNQ